MQKQIPNQVDDNIKPTKYYQLINQNTKYALYLSSGSQNFKEEKAYLWQPNEQSLGQVWQVIRIPDNIRFSDCYQIVHTRSTLVLTKVDKEAVRLRFGEWLDSQLYHLQNLQGNIFRFSNKQNRQLFLYYDSHELKLGQIDKNNKKCHWQIRLCTENPLIKRSCYIQNIFSTHVIDIPKASLSTGCALVQYPLNNRFNQRFYIHPIGQYFKISSLNSKLFITASKKCKQGDKITQEQKFQQNNEKKKQQLWLIEYQGKNSYLIRSVCNLKMFIGIKENEYKKDTNIILTENEQFGLWKFVGELPHRHEICNL